MRSFGWIGSWILVSAFEIENLDLAKRYLVENGIPIKEDKPIPNFNRFSFYDPFGNRIELLERIVR